MKRSNIIITVLVVALVVSLFSFGAFAASVTGDMNGDGLVNISDVQLLLKYVNGQDVTLVGEDGSTTTQTTATPAPTASATATPAPTATPAAAVASYEITYQTYTLYENSLGAVCCYGIIEVQNTGNVNLELSSASFSFEDANGNMVGKSSGLLSQDPDIIRPGEKGYFWTNTDSTTGDLDVNGSYTVVPEISLTQTDEEPIYYDISNTSLIEGTYGPVAVMGRITNNTEKDKGLAWVVAVFYDSNDHPLAVTGTNITSLTAGTTLSFVNQLMTFDYLDFTIDDVASYTVFSCQ